MIKNNTASGLSIAAAQIAPVWLNRAATLERVIEQIEAAGAQDVQLLAFGECLVPGYPFWVDRTDGARFESALQAELYAHYVDQAVVIEQGHLDGVCQAAAVHSVSVVLGILERPADRGESVYATVVSIDPSGSIQAAHRKLMPTYEERLVWATGDGHGLKTWPLGAFTVGALNCWENWMPLARASLQAQGEDLHIAIWPGSPRNTVELTRHMAIEGRSYVLSVSGLMRAQDLPDEILNELPAADTLKSVRGDMPWAKGGSCLAGPDGEWLIEPSLDEGLLIAELDPAAIRRARHSFDPSGHYSRPDVLKLSVNRKRQTLADFSD